MQRIVGVMPTRALILFEDNANNVAASMHPPQTIFLPHIGSFAILHPRLNLIILRCAIPSLHFLYFMNGVQKTATFVMNNGITNFYRFFMMRIEKI